jgi:hypothetical protein
MRSKSSASSRRCRPSTPAMSWILVLDAQLRASASRTPTSPAMWSRAGARWSSPSTNGTASPRAARSASRTRDRPQARLPGLRRLHFISALHGSGVGLLLEGRRRLRQRHPHPADPGADRLLEDAVQEHQPPLVRGRRIKLRYAHQGGRNPPIIVIHGNQTDALPAAYRRYLINRFRKRPEARRHAAAPGAPVPSEGRTNPYERLKAFVRRNNSRNAWSDTAGRRR